MAITTNSRVARWRLLMLLTAVLVVAVWSTLWTRTDGLVRALSPAASVFTGTPESVSTVVTPTSTSKGRGGKLHPASTHAAGLSVPFPSRSSTSSTSDTTTKPLNKQTTFSALPDNILRPSSPLIGSFLPCNWRVEDIPRPKRRRVVLQCNETSASIHYEEVPSDSAKVTSLASNDTCLKRVTKELCNDVNTPQLRVPRLVHYIWFHSRTMEFHTFVAVLSAVRFTRPCLVLVHGDVIPQGPYWAALLQLVPNLVHVQRKPRSEILGRRIALVEHSADVARLEVLLEHGGMYLDIDQYVLRPLDDLRNNSVVIATEDDGYNCGNAMILSEPRAEFLKLWLAKYSTFKASVWGYHSTVVPYLLSLTYPDLVNVVHSFYTPNWHDIEPLFNNTMARYAWTGGDGHSDWGGIYALHLYTRFYRRYFATRLDRTNSTIGKMSRYILYGDKHACFGKWANISIHPVIDRS